MADRTSAAIFAMVFGHLAEEATERDKVLARKLWDEQRGYDFHPSQMDCDESLVKLGLARLTVDSNGFEDCEYGPSE